MDSENRQRQTQTMIRRLKDGEITHTHAHTQREALIKVGKKGKKYNKRVTILTPCPDLVSRSQYPIISRSRLKWYLNQVKRIQVNINMCVCGCVCMCVREQTVDDHERSGLDL